MCLDPAWSALSGVSISECSVAQKGMLWVSLSVLLRDQRAGPGEAGQWQIRSSESHRPFQAPRPWTHIFSVPLAAASHKPTPCPAGTFSSLPEQTTSSTCRTCPSGFYCKEAGLQAPSGWCPAGKRRGEMTSEKRKGW